VLALFYWLQRRLPYLWRFETIGRRNIVAVLAVFLTGTLIELSIVVNGWLFSSIKQNYINQDQSNKLEVALAKSSTAMNVQADFLANISHEIRTPMTGLLGMLQRLKI